MEKLFTQQPVRSLGSAVMLFLDLPHVWTGTKEESGIRKGITDVCFQMCATFSLFLSPAKNFVFFSLSRSNLTIQLCIIAREH